jgi:hypothetical protein
MFAARHSGPLNEGWAYEEVPPDRITIITFLNERVRRQTNVSMIVLDVPYKSLSRFYFRKLYLQSH